MRLTEIYSPPPLKVGEFNLDAAEAYLAKRVAWGVKCDDKEIVPVNLNGFGIRFTAVGAMLFSQFEPFHTAVEPAHHLPNLKPIDDWHYDEADDSEPIRNILGSTLRPTEALTGCFYVPSSLFDGDPEILSDFRHSDDGQALIEDSIDDGDLEPVTTIEVGDLSLFEHYALHRRCSFLPEEASQTRLTLRTFELE